MEQTTSHNVCQVRTYFPLYFHLQVMNEYCCRKERKVIQMTLQAIMQFGVGDQRDANSVHVLCQYGGIQMIFSSGDEY